MGYFENIDIITASVNTITKSALVLLVTLGALRAETPTSTRIVPLDYPVIALSAVIQGEIELQAQVSSDGKVVSINATSGNPLLAAFAKKSLAEWRFTPCLSDGAICPASIVFAFVIEGQCPNRCKSEFRIDRPDHVTVRAKRRPPAIN